MLNKRLAAAFLAAALTAGCRRPPQAPVVEDATSGVTLSAPAPLVTSPLASAATDYTNEMQAQNLREQAVQLGISRLVKPTVDSGDSDAPRRTITYQEGVERTRRMTREAEEERHALEGDKNKSVAIPTRTPGILTGGKEGAPIDAAAP